MREDNSVIRFAPDYKENVSEGSFASDTETCPQGLVDILRTPLPYALSTRFAKSIALAALLFIVTIVLLALYKTLQCCLGFIISGYFVYLAISLKIDFAQGEIEEVAALCTSVNQMLSQKSCRVVFRTGEDAPVYYQFVVSGDKKYLSGLQPNTVYAIYFRLNNPKDLLGFTQL